MKVRNALTLSLALWFVVALSAQNVPSTGESVAKPQQQVPAGEAKPDAEDLNVGDPLLDVPPLPEGNVTVVGGTVAKIDQIRNRMVIEPFGGGEKMKVRFDERTHIYRDGTETTQMGIHKGDRVYVDTMLDGVQVFARKIRVQSQAGPADASGQIEALNLSTGVMTLRDQLSAEPVNFRVDTSTIAKQDSKRIGLNNVKTGSLVTLKFAPGGRTRGVVKEISVLAVPGTSFTFSGKVTFLDLRSKALAVENFSDGKTYDINFDPAAVEGRENLFVGSQVTIVATFTGSGYTAEMLTVNPESASQ
ncbi:MAG: hypothetical protein L0Z53_19000 [Acidobacteriales bacterium]|nr:hypothetical protein [Terriglobales bacterium]